MTTIAKSIVLHASKDRVWDVIADLAGVVNYNAPVTESYYISEQVAGVGAARVCEFGPNLAIQETAVAWDPGRSYTLEIAFTKGMQPPMSNIRATLSVEALGPEAARFSMELAYDTTMGPLGSVMNALMIRKRYEKTVEDILIGLQHHLQTGEHIDPTVLKRIAHQPAA